jgi:hypothetical protein
VTADDEAATVAQLLQRLGRNGAGLDVGVVDDRPHRLSPLLLRDDLRHAGRDPLLDDGEDLVDRASGSRDALPQRGLDQPDRRLQVGRRGLPVRQHRQGGDR